MKTIVFRPLRRLKSGKIAVASYAQWRKIKVADKHHGLILVIDPAYKQMPLGENVFNHNGIHLFWRNYNPENVPILTGHELVNGERPPMPKMWRTGYMVSADGVDVEGVPAFSHYTPNDIYNSKANMEDFQPLTVAVVSWWLGWFLYQLENTEIK